MKTKKILLPIIICLSLIFAFCLFLTYENKTVVTTEIEIANKKIPESFDGYRIVHISDLHNTEFGKGNKKLIEKIKKAAPDIIVMTGDMIDIYNTDIQVAVSLAEELVKISPVYFVSGNHDVKTAGREFLFSGFLEAGVNILRNRSVSIEKDGESITISGIDDPKFLDDFLSGTDEENTREVLAQINDSKTDTFNILLAHRPEMFDVYCELDIDLIFSGHAHGGQINIPLKGGLIAPGQGWFPEYYEGIYKKDNSQMIVNRGLGNSNFPFRLNNKPEIIVTELKTK